MLSVTFLVSRGGPYGTAEHLVVRAWANSLWNEGRGCEPARERAEAVDVEVMPR